MIPILLLGLFGGIGYAISRNASGPVFQTQVTGKEHRPSLQERRPALYRLMVSLKRGIQIDDWIVDEAIAEAYDCGDWEVVTKLTNAFGSPDIDSVEDQETPDPDAHPGDGDEPSDEEQEPGDEEASFMDGSPAASPSPSAPAPSAASPFKGVDDETWSQFVSAMATQKPDYDGAKHVGRFHQSKDRLSQLGIEDVSTPEKQYEAFKADIQDLRDKAASLISSYECTPVEIDGQEKVITMSGILALAKSAGVENAESWLTNPKDRAKFPKTTEMFSKANGMF